MTCTFVFYRRGLGAGAQNTRAWTVESDVDFRRWIFAYGSELLIEQPASFDRSTCNALPISWMDIAVATTTLEADLPDGRSGSHLLPWCRSGSTAGRSAVHTTSSSAGQGAEEWVLRTRKCVPSLHPLNLVASSVQRS